MNTTTQTQQPQQQKAAPAPTLGQLVVKAKEEVGQLAAQFQRTLPPSIPADKFVRTVQTAIQMNPDIARATRDSIINACMKAAADGLVLDGREAVLNVYNVKKKDASGKETWVKEAVYIPMVTGIFKRVRNTGEISRFNAFVRHENDLFKRTLGLEPSLIHEPNDDNPGKAIGAYAVCLYKDGAVDYEYMTEAQIMHIGNSTKNKDQYDQTKGKNFEEWWRKTVIRRLSKRLPMSSDLQNVIQRVDELYEPEEPIQTPGAEPEQPEQPKQKRTYTKRTGGAAAKMAEGAGETQQPLPMQQEQQPGAQTASNEQQHAPEHDPETGEIMDADYEEVDEGRGHDDTLTDDVI